MTDEKKYETEYRRLYDDLKELKRRATNILNSGLVRADLKTHPVQGRVKSWISVLDKINKNTNKNENPFEKINDLVGLRVICPFLSDIERIEEVIRNKFEVVEVHDLVSRNGNNRIKMFEYSSVHFIVRLRSELEEISEPQNDNNAGRIFEIQVRTIVMDAWASVSRLLDYKSEVKLPSYLRRELYALSGLLFIVDNHFQHLFEHYAEYIHKSFQDKSPEDFSRLAINYNSLKAFFSKYFSIRYIGTDASVSILVDQLTQSGFLTISDLESLIERGMMAFEEYVKGELPQDGFPAVDVIRFIGAVANLDFERLLYNESPPVFHEKYRKFILYPYYNGQD